MNFIYGSSFSFFYERFCYVLLFVVRIIIIIFLFYGLLVTKIRPNRFDLLFYFIISDKYNSFSLHIIKLIYYFCLICMIDKCI